MCERWGSDIMLAVRKPKPTAAAPRRSNTDTIPEPIGGGTSELGTQLVRITRQLAGLNRELASQLVLLSSQTGDTAPLVQAVQALRKVQAHYSAEQAPRDNGEVHEALADTLLKLGRAHNDREALEHAVLSYRSAITLASLVGEDAWRRKLRRKYKSAQDALAARAA